MEVLVENYSKRLETHALLLLIYLVTAISASTNFWLRKEKKGWKTCHSNVNVEQHKRLQSMMEKGTSNIMSDRAHTHVTNVMRLSLYGIEWENKIQTTWTIWQKVDALWFQSVFLVIRTWTGI